MISFRAPLESVVVFGGVTVDVVVDNVVSVGVDGVVDFEVVVVVVDFVVGVVVDFNDVVVFVDVVVIGVCEGSSGCWCYG